MPTGYSWLRVASTLGACAALCVLPPYRSVAFGQRSAARSALSLEIGVAEDGAATTRWLAMISKRLPDSLYASVAPLRRPLTGSERAWAELIRARVPRWERERAALDTLFHPVSPPESVLIVLGNRGGEDAFTHDPRTIGFDLAALHRVYGDADLGENAARIDRFFRHEYVHLLQKAWLRERPYAMDSPLRAALAEIWAEGIANHFSLSTRWHATNGRPSATASSTLATLEPRFVARLSALACAAPDRAGLLMADLSAGPFDRKWGALTMALWLEAELARSDQALRDLVLAGPEGVWRVAERRLPAAVNAIVAEARVADSLCAAR